jgi:hypothetical protein
MSRPDLVARAVASWRPAFDPVEVFTRSGMTPDPWQEKALRSVSRRIVILGGRQLGKSELVAAKALHAALYEAPKTVVVVSPSGRQSGELFKKLVHLYGPFRLEFPAASETQKELSLTSGSRIVAVPADEAKIRGLSGVGVLCVDEAAAVPDALWDAVVPMSAAVAGARQFVISTPRRPRGFLFRIWQDETGWEKYSVPASECGRIAPEFLARMKSVMAPAVYASEFCCEFSDDALVDVGNLVFPPGSTGRAALDRLFADVAPGDPEPLKL